MNYARFEDAVARWKDWYKATDTVPLLAAIMLFCMGFVIDYGWGMLCLTAAIFMYKRSQGEV